MRSLPDRNSGLRFLLIIFSNIVITLNSYAQVDREILPPVLTLVTINQITGNTELMWSSSPSTDITGYIVYLYVPDQGGSTAFPIDTIDKTLTSYSALRPYTSYYSESYVVAAFKTINDPNPPSSRFSNPINTIFCNTKIDTCTKNLTITWNKYSSYPIKVTGYDILRSVNGSVFTQAGQVSAGDTVFTTSDFINGTQYCFAVRAKLENGLNSYSNRKCVTATVQKPPQWINADYATVTSYGDISLSFSIDPASEIDLFSLERKTLSSENFSQIAQIRTSVRSIIYIDQDADPLKPNYYRLSAINSCGLKEVSSNIASNMILTTAKGNNNDIILRWSSYYKWRGEILSYRIFLDTGSGFSQVAQTEPADTVYSLNISDIMKNLVSPDICFYVTANEGLNQYGISGESMSNQSCIPVEETITVPNIFTPNGDLKNDLFSPVLAFTPSEYHLVICDRKGNVVFETRDYTLPWDGSDHNKVAAEGVYIWFLKVRTISGKNFSKTGTVTVYFNK